MVGVAGPAYHILTPRLILRPWDPAEAPELQEAIEQSLDSLRAWMDWTCAEPEDVLVKAQRLRRFRAEFDRDRNYVYAVRDRATGAVRGGTGLHPRVGPDAFEIGYWIHAAHQGRGLATESTAALVRVAFEVHHVDRIEIRCDPENLASAAIPRKLGFVHEATLARRGTNPPDLPADRMIWTLFRGDYPRSPAREVLVEARNVLGELLIWPGGGWASSPSGGTAPAP